MPSSEEEDEPLIATSERRTEDQHDRWYLVYAIFFFCGVASLLPWNFFITAVNFFKFKLRNETLPPEKYNDHNTQTMYQLNYENYLVIVSSSTNLIFTIINVFVANRIGRNPRFILGSSILVTTFVSIITLAVIDTSTHQTLFFVFSILLGASANAGAAFTQGSVIGLAGIFPQKYTKSVMEGQALGGIIASAANILTLYVASDPVTSGLMYFIIALVCILASIILFLSLPKIPYAATYIQRFDDAAARSHSTSLNAEDDLTASQVPLMATTTSSDDDPSVLETVWKVKFDAFNILFVFFITLSLFPSVLVRIVPMQSDDNNAWKTTYFTPVLCFLCFNVGDYAGRFMIGLFGVLGRRFYWFHNFLVILRVGFYPLVLMCNVQPRSPTGLPVILNNDAFPGIVSTLIGITNGYLATSSIILGVTSVRTNCMELAGNIMTLFMVMGIALGGVASLGIVELI